MHAKILLAGGLVFYATALFSMHSQKTSTQIIDEVLAKHHEIYFFNASDPEFAGEKGIEARVKEVKRRKREIIDAEILHEINKNIEKIQTENNIIYFQDSKNQIVINRSTVSNLYRYILSPVISLISSYYYGIPDGGEKSIFDKEMFDKKVLLGMSIVGLSVDEILLPHSYESKLRELSCAKEDTIHALDNDPLWDHEEKIMRAWHNLADGMKTTLVDALLSLRLKMGKDVRVLKEQIDCCLNVPKEYKQLVLVPEEPNGQIVYKKFSGTLPEDLPEFCVWRDKFISDKLASLPWCNYSENTKKQLKIVFTRVCNETQKALMGKTSQRTIIYLHGKPGAGKSRAAEEICKMFGWSKKIVLPISCKEDLSEKNMAGNSTYVPDVKLGIIFQPLFTPDDDGKTWNNPPAIIEEFDRLFNNVPSYALQILDPEVKTLKCDYLGKTLVDIGGILLILTGNSDLGYSADLSDDEDSDEAEKAFEDKLKAVRDRLIFVYFDGFNIDTQINIIKNHIFDNMLLEFSILYADSNHEKKADKIARYISKRFQEASAREIKRLAEILVNTRRDQWDLIK